VSSWFTYFYHVAWYWHDFAF